MGGRIKVAIRFSDGEAFCVERWTNNINILSDYRILENDESFAREYIQMCRNNDFSDDSSDSGKQVDIKGFEDTEYGIIVIDFLTKTIIDCNIYTTLFSFPLIFVQIDDEDVMAEIEEFLNNGFTFSYTKDNTIFETLSEMREHSKSAKRGLYTVNSTWCYEKNGAQSSYDLLSQINFPITHEKGLNKTSPYVPDSVREMAMYCVFSKEAVEKMGGNRGKLSSMAGHSYLHSYWDSLENYPDYATDYQKSGLAVKITLIVDTDQELQQIYDTLSGIGKTKVVDAGRTVFGEPTFVAVGVGPVYRDSVPDSIKQLKTFL